MADTSVSYVLVDVFARRRFAGNQLAVVLDAEHLSTYQMQVIASEFNLAETTFPVPIDAADAGAGADYRVRIFTASQEIPFAGHPTLGTAWVLARRGRIEPGTRRQACGAGLIEVQVPADPEDLVGLGATPRDLSPTLSAAAAEACATSVGLASGDVVGETVVAGCGLSFVHLPVSVGSLGRARPRVADVADVDLGDYRLRDFR